MFLKLFSVTILAVGITGPTTAQTNSASSTAIAADSATVSGESTGTGPTDGARAFTESDAPVLDGIDLTTPFAGSARFGLLSPSGDGKITVSRLLPIYTEMGALAGRMEFGAPDGDGNLRYSKNGAVIRIKNAKDGTWIDLGQAAGIANLFGGFAGNSEAVSEIEQRQLEALRQLEESVQHMPAELREATLQGAREAIGLSGGQRQRVAMARALAADPEAFLMDEPLTNLDNVFANETLRWLRFDIGDATYMNMAVVDPSSLDGGAEWVAGNQSLSLIHLQAVGQPLPGNAMPAIISRIRSVPIWVEVFDLDTGEAEIYELTEMKRVKLAEEVLAGQ